MRTIETTALHAARALLVASAVVACSSGSSDATAHRTDGGPGAQDASAQGVPDASTGTGGAPNAQGTGSAPSSTASGGARATSDGGASSGGSDGVSSGDAGSEDGGAAADGSAGAGGGMAGGTASNGGSAGTGGAKASGGTSSGAGGASGVTKSAPKPTAGCGKANPPASGAHDVDVSGTSRAYVITLPTNYDAKTPYRLVLAFHGSGGTAAKIAGNGAPGYFGLEGTSKGDAIFVALQGLETTGGTGWANTNGDDVAFVKALIAQLSASYCVDSKRIFSVGFSYGAIFTDTLGCQMGDVLRAIAPMSGAGPRVPTGGKCAGQTAAWLSHGNADMNVPLTDGQASRNFWRDANHCENMTTPVTPSPCVTYQGCDAGFPVTWCQFDGTHLVPSFAADGVWAFFAQF